MINSSNEAVLCQEVFDNNSPPSEKEIVEYAIKIGIDPKSEPHLLPIAQDGLMQALPPGWKPCYDSSLERYYYYNNDSGTSQWEHPLDSLYKEKVIRGRSEGYSSAASLVNVSEDDLKTSVKEDLRSFEEISDIMSSSRSLESKLMMKNQQSNKSFDDRDGKSSLLARRKMNQIRNEIYAEPKDLIVDQHFGTVEKMTTSTLLSPKSGKSFWSGDEGVGGGGSEAMRLAKQRLTPMRRSMTLDEVPNRQSASSAMAMRKGLSQAGHSDDALGDRPPPRRLVPISSGGWGDGEDEQKKRSVRFADLERKALDIKFDLSSQSDESEDNVNTESYEGPDDENQEIVSSDPIDYKFKTGNTKEPEKSSMKPINNLQRFDSSDDMKETKLKEAMMKADDDTRDKRIVNTREGSLEASQNANNNYTTASLASFEQEKSKEMAQKLAVIEKKIEQEFDEKVRALNEEVNANLMNARVSIRKKESNEIMKMKSEYENKIKQVEKSIEEEFKEKEIQLREEKRKEQETLLKSLREENEKLISKERESLESQMAQIKESQRRSLSDQEANIQSQIQQEIDNQAHLLKEKLNKLKKEEEAEVVRLQEESNNLLDDTKKRFEKMLQDMNVNYEMELKRCEDDQNKKLNDLIAEKESEMRRVEAEWQDKITAITSQHKVILESIVEDHDKRVANMKLQFSKDEEEIKKRQAEHIEAWNQRVQNMSTKDKIDLTHANREYEKMRCEKRLLEDKYKCLKDKYMQMKVDMRMAIERKLQRKNKRKLLANQQESDISGTEVGLTKCSSNVEELERERHWLCDNKNNNTIGGIEPPRIAIENDHSSADEHYPSLSTSVATTESKGIENKKPKQVIDHIHRQLKEFEHLDEQAKIPDSYLRYPFTGEVGADAEFEFCKHRMIIEQEAVKRAKECLAQQKRDLEVRQNLLKAATASSSQSNDGAQNLAALQQQERDLIEMEVSLLRTKALLGEKMIRLRMLGQTLDRVEPVASNNVGGGLDGVERGASYNLDGINSNNWENVDKLNLEMRNLWASIENRAFNHQPYLEILKEDTLKATADHRLSAVSPSSDPSRPRLEEKLADMKNWLQVGPSKRLSPVVSNVNFR